MLWNFKFVTVDGGGIPTASGDLASQSKSAVFSGCRVPHCQEWAGVPLSERTGSPRVGDANQ
jgi:hypothetical protein